MTVLLVVTKEDGVFSTFVVCCLRVFENANTFSGARSRGFSTTVVPASLLCSMISSASPALSLFEESDESEVAVKDSDVEVASLAP